MSLKLYCALSYCKRLSYCVSNCALFPVKRNKCYVYSSKQFFTCVTNFVPKDLLLDEKPKEVKIKRPPIPKVTLLGTDNTIVTVASLEEVQRIAERKSLKLVKIIDLDPKWQRPTYKMMTEAQYLEEDFQIKQEKKQTKAKHVIKGEKLVLISERISDNDLEQRVKKLLKWLLKKYEVRVIISCSSANRSLGEHVYTVIETAVKDSFGVIVQKRYKENDIRFSILPPKEILEIENKENKKDIWRGEDKENKKKVSEAENQESTEEICEAENQENMKKILGVENQENMKEKLGVEIQENKENR